MLASTPPSGLVSSALHMMVQAPEALLQLWLLQSLGPAAVSAPAIRRALFSSHMPLAAVQAMLPRLQKESVRAAAELLLPPPLRRPADGALPSLVVGGDADRFLPIAAFNETADHWRAEKHILAGAPHGLMADTHYWGPSAEIILDWLHRQEIA
jgi:alpha-beta hydrolase superfamily lysophospholipase